MDIKCTKDNLFFGVKGVGVIYKSKFKKVIAITNDGFETADSTGYVETKIKMGSTYIVNDEREDSYKIIDAWYKKYNFKEAIKFVKYKLESNPYLTKDKIYGVIDEGKFGYAILDNKLNDIVVNRVCFEEII